MLLNQTKRGKETQLFGEGNPTSRERNPTLSGKKTQPLFRTGRKTQLLFRLHVV